MIIRTLLRTCLLLVALFGTSTFASAQTVLVETSLGDFIIDLLPSFAPINVTNFLSYVESGRYDNTVINRAQNNFVVQAGSFSSSSTAPPTDASGFTSIVKDVGVVTGEPAASTGLSNTRSTVALALSGGPDTGSSSFFVNGGDNSFLDPTFTVFGRVRDMTTVDKIFAAPDLADGNARYGPGLTFSDIPLQPNGDLVFINRASVIPEPCALIMTMVAMVAGLFIRRRW